MKRFIYTILFGLVVLTWWAIFQQTYAQWNSCDLPWWWTIQDGENITWWTIPEETYDQTCDDSFWILTCNNWYLEWGSNIYERPICTPKVWENCKTPSGKTINHLEYTGFYTISISTYTQTCAQEQATFQCLDWDFVSSNNYNIDDYPYESCTERRDNECLHPWQETFVPNGTSLIWYTSTTSTNTQTCSELQVTLNCTNGERQWWNPNSIYSGCEDLGFKDCTVNNVNYPHLWSGIFYSNLTSLYPKKCVDIASMFSCINGTFIGDFNQYPYDTCLDWLPADCNIWWESVPHSGSITTYSSELVFYPKTCEQVSTKLSCNNWAILWNWNMFKYLWCQVTWGLVEWVDLRLDIKFLWWLNWFAQYSSPTLQAIIKNRWMALVDWKNVAPWLLTCYWEMDGWEKLKIYESKKIVQFTLNPWTVLNQPIVLNDIFTQSLGDKEISCELRERPSEWDTENNIRSSTVSIIKAERFDIAMNRSIDSIKGNLDAPEILSDVSTTPWADAVKDFLIKKIMNVLVPLIITLWILIALLGFYKIFFSNDEKSIGEWTNYIIYWVIGIILIMSANFISTTLYSNIFQEWILGYWSIQWYEIAQKLYEKIAFPFIKLAMYLALGVLFIILASRALTFVFGSDEDAKKKAGTIIARNVLGMLVIIWAKQVVEFIYGKQADVVKSVSNLWEIGSGIFANKNLPILYEIINWAMWLAALVVLIMILVQAFQLLLKPDSPDAMKKIKNSLLYIFIWILIIGTWYIITNFLIIN